MSVFESVSKGLEEALAFADGDTSGAKVHEVLKNAITERKKLKKNCI